MKPSTKAQSILNRFPEDKKHLCRDVKFELSSIKNDAPFDSLNSIEAQLHQLGYTTMSLDKNGPVAIIKNDNPQKGNFTQKWRNFYESGKSLIDGIMISNDFREGEVIALIFNKNK